MINWKITKEDSLLITMIAERAVRMQRNHFDAHRITALAVHMDLAACHANGCPLDLKGLLAASDGDFSHDLYGIVRHINRDNAQLEDCFMPRFALRAMKEVA